MKVKRFFANIILLAIVAAVVFFIGWISFYVKPGQFAVMTSKTGGLLPQPVKYGEFLWRWERLLPTNVDLEGYDVKEHEFVQIVSGSLPSADVYKTMLNPKPDFSYSFTVRTVFSVDPEKVVDLIKRGDFENNPGSLEEYLRTKSVLASSLVAEYLIETGNGGGLLKPSVLSDSQIRQAISGRLGDFDGLEIGTVEITSCRIPDLDLYEKAKESYGTYISDLNSIIKDMAGGQAESIMQLENSMKQLEQFANLLEKYPKFNDFSKSDNLSGVMDKLIQQQ